MSSPRTNNYLEGWHNKLKRIARKAHPNVFELVEIFKQEQSELVDVTGNNASELFLYLSAKLA